MASTDVALERSARPAGSAVEVWQHEPPRIALVPDPLLGPPVVAGDKIHLAGSASVPPGIAGVRTRLRDVFIFANEQKVFFKVMPEAGNSQKMDFVADVPLKPGNNAITVFAREDEEFQARRTLYAYRRGSAQVAQQGSDAEQQ
ncbi:MAG TPA: hypothetical protein VMK12_11985 [Anaeromyxobacteraceae bacterium]|nr:hypothetical protein [Anaeromyxobacteraceae bacterium]